MMIPVAITQRVVTAPNYPERRDALDQRWPQFLQTCGCIAVPMPNDTMAACALFEHVRPAGLLLTGGNDLSAFGGDAPERDAAESALIDAALGAGLPVLGVCRGMQVLQHRYGVALAAVTGHVAAQQEICIDGARQSVNSYHNFGATDSVPDLEVWARADDGVVKAVRHRTQPVTGIMWHPERLDPFREFDAELFKSIFSPPAAIVAP